MRDMILSALIVYTEWLESHVIHEGDEIPIICGIDDKEEDKLKVRLTDNREFIITVEEVTG